VAKRGGKIPANSQGETVDLGLLGLTEKFIGGRRSQYDAELDKLIADTAKSENPSHVGRKFTDIRAANSLKKRADIRGVKLEFLTLPNNQGFVVRIDPNPQSRKVKSPSPTSPGLQTGGTVPNPDGQEITVTS